MTMTANRPGPASSNIRVQVTYGPVSLAVDEHYAHLRGFWSQLGHLLDEIELEHAPKPDGEAA